MKLSEILSKIFFRSLYLTPVGIFINSLYLRSRIEKKIPGIIIKNGLVFVKEDPTIGDRIGWFINGLFISIEGWYLLKIAANYNHIVRVSVFGVPLFFFGLTALISFVACFSPRFNWNEPIPVILMAILLFIFFILIFSISIISSPLSPY